MMNDWDTIFLAAPGRIPRHRDIDPVLRLNCVFANVFSELAVWALRTEDGRSRPTTQCGAPRGPVGTRSTATLEGMISASIQRNA